MAGFTARDRAIYTVINSCTAPVWLAMILAPGSPFTRQMVRLATPLYAALGASYIALLATGWGNERVDFRDPETVRAGLAQPRGFLAGWAHYIAFDLFVGRWIWEQGLAGQRSTRLALLLTWLAGPAGLTVWLAQTRGRGVVRR